MNKPNFFIVGAAKSGTTSLADYISQHPEVYFSPVKEPFYFISDYGISDKEEYLSLFKKAGNQSIIGEASTGYLFDETSAKRIANDFPDAKIIIILRNPVKMACSLWRHMSTHGGENFGFDEAISQVERMKRKDIQFRNRCSGWWCNYLYLERALYFEQVSRYFKYFSSKNIKIYIYEEFFEDLKSNCKDLFNFLEINADFEPDYKRLNVGGIVRSKFIRWIATRRYSALRVLLPVSLRVNMRLYVKMRNIDNRKRGPEEQCDVDSLYAYYRADITKLEAFLGRKIDKWKM